MKKTPIVIAMLFSLIGFSQENQENEESLFKQNEVKINGLYLVIGAFEGTYERLLNEESGVGISLFIPIENDIDINYYVSPYYRFYFGNKYAGGFFLEGFGMLNSMNEYDFFVVNDTSTKKTVTDFALGIGLGGKWITKKGLVGEINFGVGRNLFNNEDSYDEFVGKLGITIGYRF